MKPLIYILFALFLLAACASETGKNASATYTTEAKSASKKAMPKSADTAENLEQKEGGTSNKIEIPKQVNSDKIQANENAKDDVIVEEIAEKIAEFESDIDLDEETLDLVKEKTVTIPQKPTKNSKKSATLKDKTENTENENTTILSALANEAFEVKAKQNMVDFIELTQVIADKNNSKTLIKQAKKIALSFLNTSATIEFENKKLPANKFLNLVEKGKVNTLKNIDQINYNYEIITETKQFGQVNKQIQTVKILDIKVE